MYIDARRNRRHLPAWLVVTCVVLAGCRARGAPQGSELREKTEAQLTAANEAAAQTARAYHAMDNSALLTRLVEQSSRGKEPFNSLAYRELSGRQDVNADSIVSIVTRLRDADALLPLLLLRKLHPAAYRALPTELRAQVLTQALARAKAFNTWGLPNANLEDASLALLECDGSAQPVLKTMLSDTRVAPVFGGQEHMVFLRYHYRLCDYALFFIERLAIDPKFVMPVAVSDRDLLIQQYLTTHGG